MRFRDMAVCEFFQNGRQPLSWIWSNRKWRRSIRRLRKPRPRTKHEVDRV